MGLENEQRPRHITTLLPQSRETTQEPRELTERFGCMRFCMEKPRHGSLYTHAGRVPRNAERARPRYSPVSPRAPLRVQTRTVKPPCAPRHVQTSAAVLVHPCTHTLAPGVFLCTDTRAHQHQEFLRMGIHMGSRTGNISVHPCRCTPAPGKSPCTLAHGHQHYRSACARAPQHRGCPCAHLHVQTRTRDLPVHPCTCKPAPQTSP